MISKNDFQTMLKSPEHLSTLPLEELESLVRHYPWFSLGQSVLAKAYKDQNTYKFSDQLSLASTLSSNRNWLYNYIKSEQAGVVIAETKEELVVEEAAPQSAVLSDRDELQSLALKIVDAEELPPTVSTVYVESKPIETKEAELLPVAIAVAIEPEISIDEEDNTEETLGIDQEELEEEISSVTEGMDLLDKSILATAVSSSIYLEVGEDDSQEEALESEDHEAEPSTSDDPFIQWLQQSEQNTTPSKQKGEELIGSQDLQNTQALIDKFISEEPKITPGKAEQYTGVSFAQNSLDDNFEWVTETMAKLYAIQGKVDRARKAYKRLIELHPEKKTYFENQLKVLNQRK